MSRQPNHIYEFGPFRLDVAERLLVRDGEAIPLQPKAFDLLLVLVEHHSHLLEKDELLKAVWPDTIVEEVNLANNVSVLRKALGEGGSEQQFIETVPRRGYRFVAPVREEQEGAVEPGVAEIAQAPVTQREAPVAAATGEQLARGASRWVKRRPALAVSLAVLLLIGAAGAINSWSLKRMATAPSATIKSIAVLPFKPLVANSRDEALELGMADTLITKLSSLRHLIVRPTSAVRKYVALDQDPLAAGREQRVDAVLESSMKLSGEKLRVTVRLLDVRDGRSLWAYQCTEYCTDIFAAQDAISQKVAEALALELTGEERKRLAKHYTSSAEAWQLYVRGRHLVHTRRIPDIEKANTYFQRAIDLDNSFALAHAMLGFSYTSLNWVGYPPAKELMPRAKVAFNQALKLDDQLAEAHSYLATYKHTYEWDYNGAELEHKRAIDLNPNSADVRHLYSVYLAFMGRFEQAIVEIRKAEELDPIDGFIGRSVALYLYLARRYDEAIEQSRRVAEFHPNWRGSYTWMHRAHEMLGNEQGAFAAYLKLAEADGAGPDEIIGMKAAFARGGWKGYFRRRLDRLLEQEKGGYSYQYDIAELYARLGDKEQALARLQKAVEDRNLFVVALKVDPIWDSYRADPRFVALVRRVGLEP